MTITEVTGPDSVDLTGIVNLLFPWVTKISSPTSYKPISESNIDKFLICLRTIPFTYLLLSFLLIILIVSPGSLSNADDVVIVTTEFKPILLILDPKLNVAISLSFSSTKEF